MKGLTLFREGKNPTDSKGKTVYLRLEYFKALVKADNALSEQREAESKRKSKEGRERKKEKYALEDSRSEAYYTHKEM